MRNLLILFASAASLILGACGSDVEESAGTPASAVEESAGIPASAVKGAAGTPVSAVEESAGRPISVDQLADRIQTGSPPLVLDVRTRQEYAEGHIPGAINIPHGELPERLAELPIAKSEEVVVYCQLGRRAGLAEKTLRESGYSNVHDLTGHFHKWQTAGGLPTE